MTAAFVKLFMGDNAKIATDFDSGTGYHTLKHVDTTSGGGGFQPSLQFNDARNSQYIGILV